MTLKIHKAESTGWTHTAALSALAASASAFSAALFAAFNSLAAAVSFFFFSASACFCGKGKVHCECVLADKVQNYRHTIMVDDLHKILDKPVSSFVLFRPLPPYRPSFASPFLAGCCQSTEWKTTRLQVLFRRRLQVAMQRLPSLQPIKEVHYDRYDYWARSRADAK